MIPIKKTCRFLLDKEKGKDTARIRYTIRWGGRMVRFLVGYRVEVSKWISESQRCKPNTTHGSDRVPAADINRRLELFDETINEVFYKFEQSEKTPTEDQVRESFNFIIDGGKENSNLISFYDDFLEHSKNVRGVTKNRYLSLTQTKRVLKGYNPKLRLNETSKEEVNNFTDYLFGLGYLNSTVQKHYTNLRSFLLWAKEKQYYGGDALESRKQFNEVKDKEIIYLEWDELIQMMQVELIKENDNEIRDLFVFCCFTGLRYSDAIKLKFSDISDKHISVVTKKTRQHLIIDLNNYSRSVLEKYKDSPHPTIFYPFNISFANKRLKEIAKLAGIDKLINIVKLYKNKVELVSKPKYDVVSSHCGRRTFVVTALRAGIPVEVIMKWTGHSSFESMKPYIAIVDELKAKEMDKFNKICL